MHFYTEYRITTFTEARSALRNTEGSWKARSRCRAHPSHAQPQHPTKEGERVAFGLERKQLFMLAVLMFGTFTTVLNQTVVTPALPAVMHDFGIDASTAQWLTTGFTLVNAIMIPVTAYLTDRFSTRSLFVAAMGLFTVGSLLAAWSPAFAVLLAGRLIQAAGAGVLMPMVMTVLMRTFPAERRGSAMGTFGLVIAFAPAVGPTVAGLVIDHASYHVMFLAIAVLSVIVIACSFFAVPKESAKKTAAKLDKLSVVLSTVGFGGLLYGLSTVGSYGVSPDAVVAVVVGVVALVLFFRRQLQMDEPMLNVRVLSNRRFLIGTIIGMLVQGALLAAGVLMPIYLQSLMGYSATTSGLVVLPGAVLMGAMGPIAGRLFDKHGPRALSIVGTAGLAVFTFAFATLSENTSVVFLTVLYTVRLFTLSLVNMPITTWAMNALPDELVNHGTSVNNTLRQVAGSLGTAILVSVNTMVANQQMAYTDTFHANLHGINAAFFVGGILCAFGAILTIVFVKQRRNEAAAKDVDGQRRTLLESIMKHDVYSLPETATVIDAMRMFTEKGISAAPIVNAQGEPTGFLSDGDVLRFLSKRSKMFMDPIVMIMQTSRDDQDFNDKLKQLVHRNICEIATKGIIGIDVHSSLPEVCRVLAENHLKKVPVLDDGRIVGVINRSDITMYSMKTYLEHEGEQALQEANAPRKPDLTYSEGLSSRTTPADQSMFPLH